MRLLDVEIKGGLSFGLFRSATRFTQSFHGFERASHPDAAGGD